MRPYADRAPSDKQIGHGLAEHGRVASTLSNGTYTDEFRAEDGNRRSDASRRYGDFGRAPRYRLPFPF